MATQEPTHAGLSVSASNSLKYKLGIGMQFRDKELEADFQAEVLPSLVVNSQIAGVFIAIAYLIILSIGVLDKEPTPQIVHLTRLFGVFLGLGLYSFAAFVKPLRARHLYNFGTVSAVAVVVIMMIQLHGAYRETYEIRYLGASACVILFVSIGLRGRPLSILVIFLMIQAFWIVAWNYPFVDKLQVVNGYPYALLSAIASYFVAINIHSRERSLFLERRRAKELQLAAEEATHAKTYFYSAASHDLRQPLAAMGLWVDQLSHAKSLDDAQRIGRAIKPAVSLMKEMFDSLLTSSSLELGKYEISPTQFSLKELVHTIGSEYVDRGELKGIKLIVNAPVDVHVETDYVYLSRLIRNLVHNAVTYTASGSVTVGYELVPGNLVDVFVSDTGAGIPKHLHDKIFDEFFQVANPKRDRSKGLGLGLSIVRRICQALHLNLVLDSEPDKGSRFSFQLPVKA